MGQEELEGSLTGVFGVPGSGKGVCSTRVMWGICKSNKPVRIITMCRWWSAEWPVPIIFKTNEEIAKLSLDKHLLAGMELDEKGVPKEHQLVVVDEASVVWDAMEWKAIKDASDMKDWVSQARKLKVHFVVISQSFEEFVYFIRRKLTSAHFCWRFGPMRGARAYQVENGKVGGPVGFPFTFLTWMPPERWCRKYDSLQRVGTGAAGTVVVRRSKKGMAFAGVVLVFIGGSAYWYWWRISNPFGITKPVATCRWGGCCRARSCLKLCA